MGRQAPATVRSRTLRHPHVLRVIGGFGELSRAAGRADVKAPLHDRPMSSRSPHSLTPTTFSAFSLSSSSSEGTSLISPSSQITTEVPVCLALFGSFQLPGGWLHPTLSASGVYFSDLLFIAFLRGDSFNTDE